MEYVSDKKINEAAFNNAVAEIKLFINRRLYEKKAITEEMHARAKEIILKESGTYGYIQNEKRIKRGQIYI